MLGPLVAAGRRNRKKTRNCMKKAHARNEVWRQELPQAPTVEELSGMIVRGRYAGSVGGRWPAQQEEDRRETKWNS